MSTHPYGKLRVDLDATTYYTVVSASVSDSSEPRSVRLSATAIAQMEAIQARLAVRPTLHQILREAVELGLAELERRLSAGASQTSTAFGGPLTAEEDDAA